jgi:uncharacterized protein (TIGR01244 family)
MEIKAITDQYFVTPQISVGDVPAIVEAGFKTVICNRPDAEVPPSHQTQALEAAVCAAGLTFHALPLTHQTMTPDVIAQQMAFSRSEGPVLAYCASGTRCTVAWAIGCTAEGQDIDQTLSAAQAGGYSLDSLRPTLEDIAQNRS